MHATPKRQLSLFDSTCLIVGIIVGSGIYVVSPDVAQGTSRWWLFLGIWILGGLLSLCGAIGYAELATTYPKEGGDYIYLGRAYGRWAGFLFGWIQLVVVRPGDIAGMAFVFATYARLLWDPFGGAKVPYDRLPWDLYAGADVPVAQLVFAVAAVVLLTAIHAAGVPQGKWTQNVLTTVKALGLLTIVGAAAVLPGSPVVNAVENAPAADAGSASFGFALILVLFTFGGWNEMAYVAAEVKDPRQNIVRSLVLGTAAVTVLYLLVNVAYLSALGFSGVAQSKAVASDAIAALFSGHAELAGRLFSALVCISALGAANGLIFTGARISYALGADRPGSFFGRLGHWNTRTGTPVPALIMQGLIAAGLIVLLGSFTGAVLYTAAAVYSFYLATNLAVIVLRFREPGTERPYRVTAYPLPTLVFSAVCGYLIYSAVAYRPVIAAIALGILLAGLPVYWITSRQAAKS